VRQRQVERQWHHASKTDTSPTAARTDDGAFSSRRNRACSFRSGGQLVTIWVKGNRLLVNAIKREPLPIILTGAE